MVMNQVTYINEYGDSVTFGRSFPFLLEQIDPNSLGASEITSTAVSMHGQTTEEVTYNPRTIMCKCAFNGVNKNNYDYQLRRINWQKIINTFIPDSQGTLIYENDAGKYKIECRPTQVPNFEKIIGSYARFNIDFIADNPFWRSFQTFGGAIRHVEGGLKWALRFPIRYGTWENNMIINNTTNIKTPLFIKGVVPVGTAITLSNITTGQTIKQFMPSMSIKTDFTLDTATGIVKAVAYDGSVVYQNNIFTFDSDLDMHLQRGRNELTLEYVGADTPTVTVEYNTLYLGV